MSTEMVFIEESGSQEASMTVASNSGLTAFEAAEATTTVVPPTDVRKAGGGKAKRVRASKASAAASYSYSPEFNREKRDQAKRYLKICSETISSIDNANTDVQLYRENMIKLTQVGSALLSDAFTAQQTKTMITGLIKDIKSAAHFISNSDLVTGVHAQQQVIKSLYRISDTAAPAAAAPAAAAPAPVAVAAEPVVEPQVAVADVTMEEEAETVEKKSKKSEKSKKSKKEKKEKDGSDETKEKKKKSKKEKKSKVAAAAEIVAVVPEDEDDM
ncbi:protein ORF121 [Cyprinid herpesvirus 2]|nr:protein ORF121 [Cyprinid herpesvirus 2]